MASTGDDLFAAIDADDVDRVRALLDVEPALASARDPQGVSAVLRARYRLDRPLLDAILSAQPELDVFDAAALGDIDRVSALLDADPELMSSISGDGFTALHLAAFFGKAEAARELLERGAAVDARGTGWMVGTALHSAASGNHTDVARMLLDAGADPNTRQAHGFTPLHAAMQHGNEEMIALLLGHGADPTLVNDDGKTPEELRGQAAP